METKNPRRVMPRASCSIAPNTASPNRNRQILQASEAARLALAAHLWGLGLRGWL